MGAKGGLKINNSTITTKNLIVRGVGADTGSTRQFQLNNSTISADGSSGLLVTLPGDGDAIDIHHSEISYPLSAWLRAGRNGTDGGALTVTNSTITSQGSGTQGVELLAGTTSGAVTINYTTVVDGGLTGQGLVLAGTCNEHQTTGVAQICTLPN
jgi:hypothetical protein